MHGTPLPGQQRHAAAPTRRRFGPRLRRHVLRVDGRRVHALETGDGPPLLLLHGMGGLAEEILGPLRPLASRYRLVAVDRPGYGGSDPVPDEDMAPERQAAWLRSVMRALRLSRPVVVAHSLAAAPALCLACQDPRAVSSLLLLAPFCRPTRPSAMPLLRLAALPAIGAPVRALLPLAARTLGRWRLQAAFGDKAVPPTLARLPFERMAQPSAILAMAAELRHFNDSMIPMALRLHDLPVRTVVLAGDDDEVAPWEQHALWLVQRIPNGAGACLSGVGHLMHHVRPAMVAAAVESARSDEPPSPFHRV
jgi:pimeloyl-ACP methyl ester carboxylesterase